MTVASFMETTLPLTFFFFFALVFDVSMTTSVGNSAATLGLLRSGRSPLPGEDSACCFRDDGRKLDSEDPMLGASSPFISGVSSFRANLMEHRLEAMEASREARSRSLMKAQSS